MRIYTRKTLREFWERHPDAEQPLRDWFRRVEAANWETPARIRDRFGSASFLPGNRVVFDIKGNSYRLVARIDYQRRKVFIRFVGTHAQYDRIDAAEV